MKELEPQDVCIKWGSHLAPLMECLASSTGDVLELGVGHFSTPVLHAYCLAAQRNLVSVEGDPEWFHKFKSRYDCSGHRFLIGDYDKLVPELAKQQWGVVLIDNSPGGQRRASDFRSLINCSEFVVVHDYQDENEAAISPMLDFLIWRRYVDYFPPTLVASKHPAGFVKQWVPTEEDKERMSQ